MIIRNLRFGYDGGGMSCSGYVEGAKFAEIAVCNACATYFVTVMNCDAYEHIEEVFVSEFPVMDIMMYSNNPELYSDSEYERAREVCMETYANYDEEDSLLVPEETWKSEYADVIKLAFNALLKYDSNMTDAQAAEVASKFISPYINEDLYEKEVPDREFSSWIKEIMKMHEAFARMREEEEK